MATLEPIEISNNIMIDDMHESEVLAGEDFLSGALSVEDITAIAAAEPATQPASKRTQTSTSVGDLVDDNDLEEESSWLVAGSNSNTPKAARPTPSAFDENASYALNVSKKPSPLSAARKTSPPRTRRASNMSAGKVPRLDMSGVVQHEPVTTTTTATGAMVVPAKSVEEGAAGEQPKRAARRSSGAPTLHTANRSRTRSMQQSFASESDMQQETKPSRPDTTSPTKRPAAIKTSASHNGRQPSITKEPVKPPAPVKEHIKGPSFDKQMERPDFIAYANVNKAAPSGILPTPPKKSASKASLTGSDDLTNTQILSSRTPTSVASGPSHALDTPLPLTPMADPAVSEMSEQPQSMYEPLYDDAAPAAASADVAVISTTAMDMPRVKTEVQSTSAKPQPGSKKPGFFKRLFCMAA